ncbi:MAG: glucose-6-phosphate isomerase family protein [Candidatus Staskawiczbacteria bacterium]|nr:glucose-6-phosphate isomerase family protein [Candidatus Staskawiczbacteria bacterium]
MEVDLKKLTPDIRELNDMNKVVYDKEWFKTAQNFELYYMYRKIRVENGLRYDITIIPPHMFGEEFVKTKGHIHAGFYGEIYIVLEGEGIYFAQKGDENIIEDVFAVHAKKGDAIIIPAGYGHVTINPSSQELKTANWVAENEKGNFTLFEKNQGACYYYTNQGWIKNEHYKNVPPLRFEEPLKVIPEDLEFLKAS